VWGKGGLLWAFSNNYLPNFHFHLLLLLGCKQGFLLN
jgi:hypothetical protein